MERRKLNSCGSGMGHAVSTTVKLRVQKNVGGFSANQECGPVGFLKSTVFHGIS
jgi:hypothetical protein